MFEIFKRDVPGVQPMEYLPAAAGTYEAGQLLNTSGGRLAAISAANTAKPQYLCMGDITAAAGDLVPVTRIDEDTIYETTLSAAASSAAIGGKLEISAGGKQVDATAAGAFELVYVDGTGKGSMVRGRFA